jgi:hypothetical protein
MSFPSTFLPVHSAKILRTAKITRDAGKQPHNHVMASNVDSDGKSMDLPYLY